MIKKAKTQPDREADFKSLLNKKFLMRIIFRRRPYARCDVTRGYIPSATSEAHGKT